MSCHENTRKRGIHGWTNPVIINGTALPPVLVSDHRLKEAEKGFLSDVLLKLHKERCIRGEDAM
jgi:hypothetical protein